MQAAWETDEGEIANTEISSSEMLGDFLDPLPSSPSVLLSTTGFEPLLF